MLKRKNKMTKSKLKNDLHKITSNELNFPTQAEFAEIAKHSFSRKDCEKLLKHIFKRLQSKPDQWRKILKTLTLVDTLVTKGSKQVMFEFKNKIFLIENLINFTFIEGSIDRGLQSNIKSQRTFEGVGADYQDRRS